MMPFRSRLLSVIVLLLLSLGSGRAWAEDEQTSQKPAFGRQGSSEVGGQFGGGWSTHRFAISFGPKLGYFIRDRLELSFLASYLYESFLNESGLRIIEESGEVLLEPSYHLPIAPQLLFLGGVGAGIGLDQKTVKFDIGPRVGLNILLGQSGVLTPAVRVPFLIANGNVLVGVNALLEVGAVF